MPKNINHKISQIIHQNERNSGYIGYDILFSDSEYHIKIKISNEQYCCEHFGISFHSTKSVEHFINSTIKSLEIIQHNFDNIDEQELDIYDRKIEVKVKTTKGEFSVYIFNAHNGYYKHDWFVDINAFINGNKKTDYEKGVL